MSLLLLKQFIRQFPKWALVAAVLGVSTTLFGFWWFTRSVKKTLAAWPPAAVEDLRPKFAFIESKPGRLLLVDNTLYDLDTGAVLFRNWLQGGMPLALFYDAKSRKLIARYERGFLGWARGSQDGAKG